MLRLEALTSRQKKLTKINCNRIRKCLFKQIYRCATDYEFQKTMNYEKSSDLPYRIMLWRILVNQPIISTVLRIERPYPKKGSIHAALLCGTYYDFTVRREIDIQGIVEAIGMQESEFSAIVKMITTKTGCSLGDLNTLKGVSDIKCYLSITVIYGKICNWDLPPPFKKAEQPDEQGVSRRKRGRSSVTEKKVPVKRSPRSRAEHTQLPVHEISDSAKHTYTEKQPAEKEVRKYTRRQSNSNKSIIGSPECTATMSKRSRMRKSTSNVSTRSAKKDSSTYIAAAVNKRKGVSKIEERLLPTESHSTDEVNNDQSMNFDESHLGDSDTDKSDKDFVDERDFEITMYNKQNIKDCFHVCNGRFIFFCITEGRYSIGEIMNSYLKLKHNRSYYFSSLSRLCEDNDIAFADLNLLEPPFVDMSYEGLRVFAYRTFGWSIGIIVQCNLNNNSFKIIFDDSSEEYIRYKNGNNVNIYPLVKQPIYGTGLNLNTSLIGASKNINLTYSQSMQTSESDTIVLKKELDELESNQDTNQSLIHTCEKLQIEEPELKPPESNIVESLTIINNEVMENHNRNRSIFLNVDQMAIGYQPVFEHPQLSIQENMQPECNNLNIAHDTNSLGGHELNSLLSFPQAADTVTVPPETTNIMHLEIPTASTSGISQPALNHLAQQHLIPTNGNVTNDNNLTLLPNNTYLSPIPNYLCVDLTHSNSPVDSSISNLIPVPMNSAEIILSTVLNPSILPRIIAPRSHSTSLNTHVSIHDIASTSTTVPSSSYHVAANSLYVNKASMPGADLTNYNISSLPQPVSHKRLFIDEAYLIRCANNVFQKSVLSDYLIATPVIANISAPTLCPSHFEY